MMLHEIELAWYDRITNLMVEGVSKVMIDMVNQDSKEDHNWLTLIHRIIRMTHKN